MLSARRLAARLVRQQAPQQSYAENFERTPEMSSAARDLAARAVQAWGWGRQEDVLVVTAELVSNAVQHASGAGMRVTVTRTGEQHVRVAVIDRSRQRPRVQPPQGDLERGRGMLLVAGLAQEWGVDVLPGGKIVWADLAVDP